jgi:hypothetical protein
MKIRNAFCCLTLLTITAIQPALAAKPAPAVESLELANVPMKSAAADEKSAVTVKTTPGDDVGFRVEELFEAKACPSGGNATFTWTILDGCGDGQGLYVRFFDETNDIDFPNSSQVYSIKSGHSGVIRLSVKRGAKICYGAEPSDEDGTYWGVSLDNNQECASCCNIVPNSGNLARSVRLLCD